jgi:hypothetical protein
MPTLGFAVSCFATSDSSPSISSYSPASDIRAIVHPVPGNLAYGGIRILHGITNVASPCRDAEHAASGSYPAAVLFAVPA